MSIEEIAFGNFLIYKSQFNPIKEKRGFNLPNYWFLNIFKIIYFYKKVRFHKDWNEIMVIINQINKRDYVTIWNDECRIHALNINEFEEVSFTSEDKPLIEVVWSAVVQYIKIINKLEGNNYEF